MCAARKIKLFGLDVDGTLTSGMLIFNSLGECHKVFNVQDGMGITIARKLGYKVVFITGRQSPMVEARAKELHVDQLIMGCVDKVEAMDSIRQAWNLEWDEIAYMGDDINDLALAEKVGIFAVPANACADNLALADLIMKRNGGEGAAREFIENIIRKQARWEEALHLFI